MRITAGEFTDQMLGQDIQVKEEKFCELLSMILKEMPGEIRGKNLVCKIDYQVSKAVFHKKGPSQFFFLNDVGNKIF